MIKRKTEVLETIDLFRTKIKFELPNGDFLYKTLDDYIYSAYDEYFGVDMSELGRLLKKPIKVDSGETLRFPLGTKATVVSKKKIEVYEIYVETTYLFGFAWSCSDQKKRLIFSETA